MADGYKIKTDMEGVNALLTLAKQLPEAVEMAKQASDLLKEAFEERKTVLGPHTSEINAILETVDEAQSEGSGSVIKVQLSLAKAAAALRAIIEKNLGGSSVKK